MLSFDNTYLYKDEFFQESFHRACAITPWWPFAFDSSASLRILENLQYSETTFYFQYAVHEHFQREDELRDLREGKPWDPSTSCLSLYDRELDARIRELRVRFPAASIKPRIDDHFRALNKRVYLHPLTARDLQDLGPIRVDRYLLPEEVEVREKAYQDYIQSHPRPVSEENPSKKIKNEPGDGHDARGRVSTRGQRLQALGALPPSTGLTITPGPPPPTADEGADAPAQGRRKGRRGFAGRGGEPCTGPDGQH